MDNDGEPGTSRRDDGAMDEDIPGYTFILSYRFILIGRMDMQ